jgi:hypothetical protein
MSIRCSADRKGSPVTGGARSAARRQRHILPGEDSPELGECLSCFPWRGQASAESWRKKVIKRITNARKGANGFSRETAFIEKLLYHPLDNSSICKRNLRAGK